MRHQASLHHHHSIRQIKVYMINHTKIYVEHEGRVNLLFQLLPAEGINKNFSYIRRKIGGCGIRVPVADGSLTDITFNVNRAVNR
jgi:hypothetical protein